MTLRASRRAAAALVVYGFLPLGGLGLSVPVQGLKAQELAQAPEAEPASPSKRRGRRAKKEAAPATPPGMQQAVPLATFGDWNVFTSLQGKDKLCYAIAQPSTRVPKTLKRDTGFLFVTMHKGVNAQGEIAVMFGFKPKPAASQLKAGAAAAPSDPYLTVGTTRYGLVVKDENAWVQNQAEEAKIVTDLGRAQVANVRTTSARGNPTNDEYALGGFAEALKRARDECK